MRIGIVGGGIAGLTAAYRLSKAGHRVDVFEALPLLGGQAGTFPVAGTRLEYYYHHLFPSDRSALKLIDELGLSDKMVWLESKVGYFSGGTIYDFVTPLDLLRFRPLPLASRLLLGLQTLWLQTFGDWRKLERITAKEWVLRWGGRAIYDVIWGALLRAKYGQDADRVSMAWLWGKLAVRRSLKGSGVSRETLGYMMGSFQQLTEALAARIRAAGGSVWVDSPVERVRVVDSVARGLILQHEGVRAQHDYDAVILTVPSPLVLDLAPELPEGYARLLRDVRYMAVTALVLKLKHSLSRIYWLNLPEPDIPLVGAIEHTNYVGPEHYEGAHILYLSNYLQAEDPHFGLGEAELLALYTPYIRRINPAFSGDWVEESWQFRDRYGQPVIEPGYSQRIPTHRTPISGLYLANTTQIYPEDRGVNYSVRLGEAVSEIVQGREAHVSARW